MKTKSFENAVLILQGQPASGKTTLARRLYSEFKDIFTHKPLITKDGFKDAFFEHSPYDSSEEGIEIGRKYHAGFSYAAVAETGRVLSRAGLPFVVDGNFGHQFDVHLSDWRAQRKGKQELVILQILLGCDPDVLANRLRTRLQNANPEEINPANIVLGVDTAISRIGDGWLPRLAADYTIAVDNTDPEKAYPIIQKFLQEHCLGQLHQI